MEKLNEILKYLEQGKINTASLPLDRLDKSFYRQCKECNKWRMIGTQCKNPMTMKCDNNERYFYNDNDA